MEPIPFKVTEKKDASFHIQINQQSHLYGHLHFHPEYQLSLILTGTGTVSVGSSIGRFGPGDVYFIGSNVPHVFKRDERPQSDEAGGPSRIISLFFREESLGRSFFQLPEMVKVNSFLEASAQGVKLSSPLREQIRIEIEKMERLSGAARLIQLLALLNELALSPHKTFLTEVKLAYPEQPTEYYPRLNRIFRYISENFDQPISLEDVAEVANLSKYSFSRYFKRSTNKSFINYLNEFRIGMACRFLTKSNYSISQIGFQSGFNNLSNFYRHFKRIMNCTPSEYRELQKKLR